MGRLGLGSIPPELGDPSYCDSGTGLCWTFNSQASLSLSPAFDEKCYSVEWQTDFDTLGVSSFNFLNSNSFNSCIKKGLFQYRFGSLVRRCRGIPTKLANHR